MSAGLVDLKGQVPFVAPEQELQPKKPPTVTLWRVLVAPYKQKDVTDGGILLSRDVVENSKWLTVCGRVVQMGEKAFSLEKLQDRNNPKVGDWVIYGKYAGQRIQMRDGQEYVIMNDDEILGVVEDPSAFVTLV